MTNATRPGRPRPLFGLTRVIAVATLACLALAAGPPAVVSAAPATITVAGDIATCGGTGDSRTAAIVKRQPGIVMTAGDNVYPSGTFAQFRDCYDPTWGAFRGRTRPAPGNHDHETAGAAGYFRYFGKRAGPAGRGYYTFTAGTWRVYVLDTTLCLRKDLAPAGCGARSAQHRWLEQQLAANRDRCILAVAHHPRFSTGVGGNHPKVSPLLWALYRAGAELVINGHDHSYERFELAQPDGTVDRAFGQRQIVVGTGGAYRTPFREKPVRHSLARMNSTMGVLRLDLTRTGYSWRLLRTDGARGDSGEGTCHGRPDDEAAAASMAVRAVRPATKERPATPEVPGAHATDRQAISGHRRGLR